MLGIGKRLSRYEPPKLASLPPSIHTPKSINFIDDNFAYVLLDLFFYFRTADGEKVIKIQGNKFVDSGGGFLIEQPLLQNETDPSTAQLVAVIDEALQIPVVYLKCMECCKDFVESYLMTNFNFLVGLPIM